ncbi:hypothetical protein MHYP_G00216610 [Metynnis hypsauchen]
MHFERKWEISRITSEVEIEGISTKPNNKDLLLQAAIMEELSIPGVVWSGHIDAVRRCGAVFCESLLFYAA